MQLRVENFVSSRRKRNTKTAYKYNAFEKFQQITPKIQIYILKKNTKQHLNISRS